MAVILNILLLLITLRSYVFGHGMMMDPVGRASRWRFNESAPINTSDNELFCGGMTNLWTVHNGKCGFCGDDYALPAPRPHENGGEYGAGDIVSTYRNGEEIQIIVKITANHNGYFIFDLCNLDIHKETEECFERNKLTITDGSNRYYLPSKDLGLYYIDVFLPYGISCKHCVLRWQYIAANMWGQCGNGTGALGCGPQEMYRSCADITIQNGRWK